MSNGKNYYEILRINASAEEYIIRAAYRALASNFHPDKNLENIGMATSDMQLINEAYAVLSNPEQRNAYDEMIGKVTKNASQYNASLSKIDARELGRKLGRKFIRGMIEELNKKSD